MFDFSINQSHEFKVNIDRVDNNGMFVCYIENSHVSGQSAIDICINALYYLFPDSYIKHLDSGIDCNYFYVKSNAENNEK